jgi:hypothetical protein
MRKYGLWRAIGSSLVAACVAAGTYTATAALGAQAVSEKQTTLSVQLALQRLPYYGVFDFLSFTIDRGTVTLMGYAYREELKKDAEAALKRVSGVEQIVNNIEVLEGSTDDDRIRWATFYAIYTDNFLSRYAPGGPLGVRAEVQTGARFPGTQPLGNYPIHIIVKNRRTMLFGLVNNEADKTVAGMRAREITETFGVENEIVISK